MLDNYCVLCQEHHQMTQSCLQDVHCKKCGEKVHLRKECDRPENHPKVEVKNEYNEPEECPKLDIKSEFYEEEKLSKDEFKSEYVGPEISPQLK
jgi:hypothetical protein